MYVIHTHVSVFSSGFARTKLRFQIKKQTNNKNNKTNKQQKIKYINNKKDGGHKLSNIFVFFFRKVQSLLNWSNF